MNCYVKDYPRPQFVRDHWDDLSGEWNFLFDDDNVGEEKKYYNDLPADRIINVPFTYETEASGINDQSQHDNVWYQRDVFLSKPDDKRVIIHFEGSDYVTKLWINGRYVGKNIGGYHRFSFDITDELKNGLNTFTVKAEDSLSKSQARGKQRYKKESFECWYVQTTGIWKTVWLEYVDRAHLNYVKNTPDPDTRTVALEFETSITEHEFQKDQYSIRAVIKTGERTVTDVTEELKGNNQKMLLMVDENIFLWDVKKPFLYDIEYRLMKNGKTVDVVRSYFGFRKIEIKDSKIYLNGKELYQKLVLDQGYWKKTHLTPPSEQALIDDIDFVLDMGFNGVRKHQKIEDERFLYWCDVKGALMWSEMANCYSFDAESTVSFTNEWMKAVKQSYNHPCIITWVPINESWGVHDIAVDRAQQNYADSLYYWTKGFDTTRPVIANDGWDHTICDIITVHDYHQSGKEIWDRHVVNKEKILESKEPYNSRHCLMSEGYSYKGQPVIMSEYGGVAIRTGSGWGYGEQEDTENGVLERYRDLTETIKKVPYYAGFCYTQLTDVQQEVNGLLDENRHFKYSQEIYDAIRDINND